MIKVDYFKMEVSGEWIEKFQDIKVMEKAILRYVKWRANRSSRPFIYKKVNFKINQRR